MKSKGIRLVTADSSSVVHIRFRIQNRLGLVFRENDDEWRLSQTEFRTRRCRLRLDGQVFNPRLTYALQLSFTRADQDWDNAEVPNILRDAMIFYQVSDGLRIGFGQGKLPGNRQRVISSGEQQMIDRSIANAAFNIDRDFGVQAYYKFHTGRVFYNLRGAITSGEGRNEGVADSKVAANPGLCYTGRMELLPLGDFTDHGDYFEGDLLREEKPKLSIAGGACYNDAAIRTGGQLGRSLYASRTMVTYIADALFKWKGLSITAEYFKRTVENKPATTFGDQGASALVYTGVGTMLQGGFLLKKDYEIVARFAQITPDKEIQPFRSRIENYTLGVNKYIALHRVKCQFDVTYEREQFYVTNLFPNHNLQLRFQLELGI